MKFFKRCACILVSLLMAVSVTACSAKSPVDAAAFKTVTEKYKLTNTDQKANNTSVKSYVSAQNAAANIAIQYIAYDSASGATELYSSFKKQVDDAKPKYAKTSSIDTATYNKYTLEVGEIYEVVVRMEHTLVYAKCDIEDKGTVDNVLKGIKY